MLEQASPVLLYHTQYTLYIIQPSTRVRCSEARLAVLQTVNYTVYITQPRTGVHCSEESVLQRCSVAVLQWREISSVTAGVTWAQSVARGEGTTHRVTIKQLWPVCHFTTEISQLWFCYLLCAIALFTSWKIKKASKLIINECRSQPQTHLKSFFRALRESKQWSQTRYF